ncbi:ABC transporter ATP-binding protein [Oerskovia enterophila]|uniref:ABC-type quaternary amine transporter n=1 Tax=Oerskovia enterophila TaxID=43678 RepID=A0A163PVC1_9CELL|nr:Fe(3+) ions import ATP-binding protein FbpC [Oerskovia enterophila]
MDGATVVERTTDGSAEPYVPHDLTGSTASRGLTVRDVVVHYPDPASSKGPGTTAVRGVGLDLAPGEVLALLGPSGCGKSSLLRAVAGLEPVAGGSITWDGRDLAGVPVHRRGFGLMFQEGQLFPHRDVAGNVAFGLQMAGVKRSAAAGRVAELLDVVGLAGYAQRPVATLSGGERQRVALARALAPEPQLLLLDEPLSALDRGLRDRLAADLRAALVATGTTALFVTHDHDEAFTVADRVAVMDAGRLLQVAAPEDLWRAPASRRVAEFLGYQAFVALGSAGSSRSLGDSAADFEADFEAADRLSERGRGVGRGGSDRSLATDPLSERGRGMPRGGSDNFSAAGGELLAIGPTGLVLVPGAHATDELSERGRGTDRRSSDNKSGAWSANGTVVRSAFRRGRTEVTVDVDLGAGPQRVVALGMPSATPVPDGATHHSFAPAPGERVRVALDLAGCAVVPADS